jgi:hypothetical protein
MGMIAMNLIPPKAAAWLELLFKNRTIYHMPTFEGIIVVENIPFLKRTFGHK